MDACYMMVFSLACMLMAFSGTDAAYCPNLPSSHPCKCSLVGTHVRALDIDCEARNIRRVPDFSVFEGMPIQFLNLANNNLDRLPAHTFNGLLFQSAFPRQDPTIDISSNPLRNNIDPRTFVGMRADTLGMRIEECGLHDIPRVALNAFTNWTFLFLDENMITELPSSMLEGQKKLRHLELDDNPIRRIDDKAFAGLEDTMQKIHVSNAEISEFPVKALKKLKHLSILTMIGNHIVDLPSRAFGELGTTASLFILDLSRNGLKMIPADVFRGAEFKLETLILRYNEITDLSFLSNFCEHVFDEQPTINLLDNAVACDCDVVDLVHSKRISVDAVCSTPDKFRGLSIEKDHMSSVADEECPDAAGTCPRPGSTDEAGGSSRLSTSCVLVLWASVSAFMAML